MGWKPLEKGGYKLWARGGVCVPSGAAWKVRDERLSDYISGVTWMPQVTSKLRGFSREQAGDAGCVVTAAGSGICLSAQRVLRAPLTLRISHL